MLSPTAGKKTLESKSEFVDVKVVPLYNQVV